MTREDSPQLPVQSGSAFYRLSCGLARIVMQLFTRPRIIGLENFPRQGGVLVLGGALAGGKVADPAVRDPDTVTLREVVKSLRDADEWIPALLPTGDGLLCAVKR